MAEKKIRFTAEENIRPIIRGLSEEYSKLGRKLIDDSRAYTTSGKEALKYIEDQIKAKERLISLEGRGARSALERAYGRGDVGAGEYKRERREISITNREEQQQVSLLRELINTIKSTASREVIEDRKNVEKRIKASKTVDELGPQGESAQILKETVQRQKLSDVKRQETEEKEGFKYGKSIERGSGILGGVAGSQNQFYALAATLAMIPVIGQGASRIATKAFSSAERYQEGLAGMSQLTGLSQRNFYGAGGDLTNIGYTKADFLSLQRRAAIAGGGAGGSKQAARDIAFLERGTGFGADLFLQQERLTRAGGGGARAGTQRFVRGLQAGGMMQGQDTSLLGEYLPLMVQLQQEQVRIAGETNDEIASNLVTGIASLDESFKNPDVLRGILPTLMAGARTPASPQVEALQFRALSKMPGMAGASLTDLMEQRETPSLNYIGGLIEQAKSLGGNEILNIKGMFPGLSTSEARRLSEGYGTKGFNMGEEAKQMGLVNVEKRAGIDFGTGDLKASTAKFTEKFETVGQALTDAIQSMVGVGGELKEGLEKFAATISQAEKDRKESVDALLASESKLERTMGFLAGSRPVGFGPR